MPRSLKKGPFVDHHLMKKVDEAVKLPAAKAPMSAPNPVAAPNQAK